jgi:hypothetical protein
MIKNKPLRTLVIENLPSTESIFIILEFIFFLKSGSKV